MSFFLGSSSSTSSVGVSKASGRFSLHHSMSSEQRTSSLSAKRKKQTHGLTYVKRMYSITGITRQQRRLRKTCILSNLLMSAQTHSLILIGPIMSLEARILARKLLGNCRLNFTKIVFETESREVELTT